MLAMIDRLDHYRDSVRSALEELAATHLASLSGVNRWGDDLAGRIHRFALGGKLIRGSLVALGCELFGATPGPSAYGAGAALELIQSFLLIHDDIMDEDRIRRGAPSVVEQYRVAGVQLGYRRTDRFAESMAICAGDAAVMIGKQPAMSGQHELHVGTHGQLCAYCHYAVVNEAKDIINESLHMNGSANVLLLSGEWDAETGTCTNTCHSEPRTW